MNQPNTSIRSHCLSPARARATIDAPLAPTPGRWAASTPCSPDRETLKAKDRFVKLLPLQTQFIYNPIDVQKLSPEWLKVNPSRKRCTERAADTAAVL
jgi:hypothetical protein